MKNKRLYTLLVAAAPLLTQPALANDEEAALSLGALMPVNDALSIDPLSVEPNEVGVEFAFSLNGEDGAAFCSANDVNGKGAYNPYGLNEIRMDKNVFWHIGNGQMLAQTASDFQPDDELVQVTFYNRGDIASYECEYDPETLFVKDCKRMDTLAMPKSELFNAVKYYTENVCGAFFDTQYVAGVGANRYPAIIDEMEADVINQLARAGVRVRFTPKLRPLAKEQQ